MLSTPIVRTIKTQLDAEIHYLTSDKLTFALAGNPYLEKVQAFENSDDRKILSKTHFDVLIDLQNNRLSRSVKVQADEVHRFKHERLNDWLFLNLKVNRLRTKHYVDQCFELLNSLNIIEDNLGLDYFIPEKDEVELSWLPQTHSQGYAAIAIDAPTSTQLLHIDRLIELCDRINKPIILLGSQACQPIGEEVANFFKPGTEAQELELEELNKKATVFNGCGKFNLNQQASLVKQASWVFTYENELMHLAAAFKKKIYTLWGSSSPLFGEYPYRTAFTIFENNKINCRPCSKTGHSQCPKKHFKCMNDLTFDFYLPDY